MIQNAQVTNSGDARSYCMLLSVNIITQLPSCAGTVCGPEK